MLTAIRARRTRPVLLAIFVVVIATLLAALGDRPAQAALQEGGGGRDVLIGRDNDNASNVFIQPSGVNARQHLDNTDILRGDSQDDLLIGRLGDDVLWGDNGNDILVGGPEAGSQPNSDVIFGDNGDDINIWVGGDGSDAFVGGQGRDTMVFAGGFAQVTNGVPQLVNFRGRSVPLVPIDNQPQFSCTIHAVPANQQLGFRFIVRFLVNNNVVVTVRQQNVEQVLCSSPNPGTVLVADLTRPNPAFVERPLSAFRNTTLGAIIQAR
jgi:hypothetical protein